MQHTNAITRLNMSLLYRRYLQYHHFVALFASNTPSKLNNLHSLSKANIHKLTYSMITSAADRSFSRYHMWGRVVAMACAQLIRYCTNFLLHSIFTHWIVTYKQSITYNFTSSAGKCCWLLFFSLHLHPLQPPACPIHLTRLSNTHISASKIPPQQWCTSNKFWRWPHNCLQWLSCWKWTQLTRKLFSRTLTLWIVIPFVSCAVWSSLDAI